MSISVIILSTTSSVAYSVECLGLKPYWLPGRSLELSRCNDNLLNMICSITFDMTGRREIGL